MHRPHEPLTTRLRELAAGHARQRGAALHLPSVPLRVLMPGLTGGRVTRDALIAAGVLVPPRAAARTTP